MAATDTGGGNAKPAMLATLRTLLARWFAPSAAPAQPIPEFLLVGSEGTHLAPGYAVPYDENLLERARTQWQFGDWQSLARLERDTLQHHPERARLALLAAAGHLQTDNPAAARQFIRLARDWGCSKKLLTQVLVAGVHNSLGRAAAIVGQEPRARQHFETAIVIGTPGSDARLLTRARIDEQHAQLGLAAAQGFARVGAGETAVATPPGLASRAEGAERHHQGAEAANG